MSCSVPRLVSYYSNKVNIYDSNCFIALPNYRTCPPPSCIILGPPNGIPPMMRPAIPFFTPSVCGTSNCNTAPTTSCCTSCK